MTVETIPENSVPVLQEWLLLTQAARMIGLSRQRLHTLAKQKRLKTLHRLGDDEDRPIFVISRDEVMRIKSGEISV